MNPMQEHTVKAFDEDITRLRGLIAEMGGLWKELPRYAVVFLIVMLSSIGLPGLNGFVGEFLILIGAFQSMPVAAAVGATGVVLGAAYMLWMFQRVMFGPVTNPKNRGLPDLSARETLVLAPLVVLIFVMGIYPAPFLRTMDASVRATLVRAGIETEISVAPAAVAAEHDEDEHAEVHH